MTKSGQQIICYYTKLCSKCGEEKTLTNFHHDRTTKTRYASQCKECRLKMRELVRKFDAHQDTRY